MAGSGIQRQICKIQCMLRINLHSGIETEKEFTEERRIGFSCKKCLGIFRHTEQKSTKKCSYKSLNNI